MSTSPNATLELLAPRAVPLGGLRAMSVSRTLPQRSRSTIGAWCFIDHFGADESTAREPMWVTPHPHIGLQTVSWLFSGAVEHRDSIGSLALAAPNRVSLMTAGRGISHSEISTETRRALRGVQLWVALPSSARATEPGYQCYDVARTPTGDAELAVFLGTFAGRTAPGATFSDLFGAELLLPAGASWRVPLEPGHELGVLVDRGDLRVTRDQELLSVAAGELGFAAAGGADVWLHAGEEPVRALVLGGTPFDEPFVMWWNFIGGSHEEIATARESWQRDVVAGSNPAGRFGSVAGGQPPIPAPELPSVRLKPRLAPS